MIAKYPYVISLDLYNCADKTDMNLGLYILMFSHINVQSANYAFDFHSYNTWNIRNLVDSSVMPVIAKKEKNDIF